ncbi:ABC transporter ATP-binding protein [Alkalihalobacillus sp. LMS39]|uniref:ABC transporter ATP-binding protein n=1 Tax=Alkalihalobacillus sp. LMS39 TaxID=2924032 RepID=UPI001FB1F22D|nr:ABC transporter ATP-binding protein [Alkalihalobacillus sp. LMS39]UOE94596.1 ABC transporter ATP-binding protein/permease [Alkalihalobacillus sp. LMS39]
MSFKQLRDPFRYEKIPLETKEVEKKEVKVRNWYGTIKRIWRYLATDKKRLFLVLLMVIVSSGLGLLGPFIIGMTIDEYIVNVNTGMGSLLLALLCAFLFHSLSILLQNFWMIGIAQKTVFSMRQDLFQHLHTLPISFFDKRQHGELMSRITNDIENVSSTLNSSVIQIFSSILTLVGMVTVMVMISPLLTVITLSVIPFMFYGLKWITKRTGKLFKEQQKNVGQLNGFIEETLSGQKIVKTFSQEKKVMSVFKEKSAQLKVSGFWAQTFSGFIPKLMNVLNNLNFALIAGVGGLLALNGLLTIGAIVIFAEYSRQFTRPLNDLANQFNTLLSAVAGAERVFDIIDEKEEESDESKAKPLLEVKGDVQFKNVSFSYETEEQTLSNVSFSVKKGETVAFVGPTGAGKTTILNILSRFYDADSGEIYIDGHEIKMIQRASVRGHMGFVLQDPFLFEDTIFENIRYGRLSATDEEVIQAAKLANAHSFISRLPNQYNTVLSQDGTGISQGQRQLLSIARAILANPSILILDEATSSIDTVTEIKIQEALQILMAGRTSFVIAHRLNTIQQADQIIVLDDGQLVESGTHTSLIEKQGYYYHLFHAQIKQGIS